MAPKQQPSRNDRRQGQRNRPRTASAYRRQRRQARRRSIISSVVVVAIILVFALALLGYNSTKSASSTTTSSTTSTTAASTTTAKALPSAKGKPCVKMNDTLPKGAPAVPVQVGAAPTKLVTRDLKVGTGAVVKAGATLTVDYIGVACSTGKIFDSSYATGSPASFPLANVIPGWQQGIPGMKVGGERLLGIPSALAYGTAGYPPKIAPDEALWFVVTVRSAK